MWSKKTFLTALIVLILTLPFGGAGLTTVANADGASHAEQVILKLNDIDATMVMAEVEGKDNLIIGVGSTSLTTGAAQPSAGLGEIEPNNYSVEVDYGTIEAVADGSTSLTTGADTNSSQAQPSAGLGEYSFAFENELVPATVSLVANNDMVVDGTSVKAGDKIYELVLFYIPETDTVLAVGVDLESLISTATQAETATESQSGAGSEPETEAELRPALGGAKPKPKQFMAMSEQERKRLKRLRYFPSAFGETSPLGGEDREGSHLEWRMPSLGGDWRNEKGEIPATYQTGLPDSLAEFSGDVNAYANLIEIPADTVINTNTIWDSNVFLWGRVEVNNAMLIIKPGVKIKIYNEADEGIVVRNNGCIIANGTPDNDGRICFLPDTWIPYISYGCAIKLEETASPLCEISYCRIYYAYIGILTLNKMLEKPIHDNLMWDCTIGIAEDGPMLTSVVNNEVHDITDPVIFSALPIGIGVSLIDVCGIASATASIYIANNTIAGNHTYGIYIVGVEDPNEAGEVTVANNLIAGSGEYAICPVNGWMQLATYCNGFYGNNRDVYGGTGGSWMSGGIVDPNSVIVEDFNSYGSNEELKAVWKDYYTHPAPKTAAEVQVETTTVIDGNSMKYEYKDYYWPYYSEAEAEICDLPRPALGGVGSDWTAGDVNTLTLYFFGQFGNDSGEQMYVKLTDGDEVKDFNSLDNFDSYGSNGALKAVWKDYWSNGSCAEVFTDQTIVRSGQSMWYQYKNYTYPPYYSEAVADIAALDTNNPNWLETGVATLSLRFYGQAGNDVNEDMYIKLIDGGSPAQTTTVFYRDYGDINDVREERWHVWNIDISNFIFANWDFDITKVAKIVIGFGDGTQAESDGVVYFEDIRLYKEYPPPEHSATVEYDGCPEYIKEPRWHVWNIPLAEFNDVNLGNIAKITIGFGDWTSPGGEPNGKGTVYFEDIILRNGPAEDIYYDGSVYLAQDPFENGYTNWPLLLKQDCRLIDGGGDYIDGKQYLIGKTTAWEGTPDNNVADIGFHYFNWYYVNAWDSDSSFADLDDNNTIDLRDFAILADGWEEIYDINDLKIMADKWLWTVGEHLPIAANITGDPNNLTGDMLIRISGLSYNITQGFIYVDGILKGYINYIVEPEAANNCLPLDTKKLDNGKHSIKVATTDSKGLITMSEVMTVDTNNELYYVTKGVYFEPNDGYHVYAMSDTNNNFRVRLAGWDGNTIWTSDASTGGLNVTVPSSVLTGQIYNIVIEIDTNEPLGWRMLCEDPSKKRRTKGPYKVAIFLPNGSIEKNGVLIPTADTRQQAVDELEQVCKKRQMNYIILYGVECTWENFAAVLSQPTISYVYMVGHGSNHLGTEPNVVSRLNFVVSAPDLGYWGTETVVSYKGGLPSNIYNNPRVHSMESLGLNETTQIRCVYMTVCCQGQSNEMARQWLDWSFETPLNQLFCGWEGCPLATDPDWQDWDYQFWHRWCSGDEPASEVIGGPGVSGGLFGRYPDIWSYFKPIGWTQIYFTTSGN